MLSDDQIKQKTQAVTEEWWKYCRTRTLLSEDHNFTEVFQAVFEYAKSHDGNVDVADVTRIVSGLGDIDRGGRLRYHKSPVVQAASQGNNIIPWANEPLLRTVISMEAVRQMTSTQLKMVSSLYPYDTSGNTIVPIGKKFEERVAWLKANPNVDPSAVAEAIERVLGKTPSEKPQDSQEGGVRRLTRDERETVIRERILRESRPRTFWTDYGRKKFTKLNKDLDELLTDQEKRVYRDRSRGSVEILRGWAAVEKIMDEKIRDYESVWH